MPGDAGERHGSGEAEEEVRRGVRYILSTYVSGFDCFRFQGDEDLEA